MNRILSNASPGTNATMRNCQTFAANGNFVVPPGVTSIRVIVKGGGGPGGIVGDTATLRLAGSGGGEGGYSEGIFSVAPGTVYPVTVGQASFPAASPTSSPPFGNSSSFGSLLSATGGQGGDDQKISPGGCGGRGGVGIGGQINLTGQMGGTGISYSLASHPVTGGTGGGMGGGTGGQGSSVDAQLGPCSGVNGGGGGGQGYSPAITSVLCAGKGGAGYVIVQY